jgi:hypothetical protein
MPALMLCWLFNDHVPDLVDSFENSFATWPPVKLVRDRLADDGFCLIILLAGRPGRKAPLLYDIR